MASRVSDHAVIRYLERIVGVDVEAIRADIRLLASESVQFKNCDGFWNKEFGAVFMLNEENAVVTILGKKEGAKYLGRRLVDGSRAGAETEENTFAEIIEPR